MVNAVSLLSSEITQSEFIKRELGITILKIDQTQLCDLNWEGQVPLIVTEQVEEFTNYLLNRPSKSVGVIMIGNEYYDRNRITLLSQFPSVKFVLSENVTSQCPLINLKALLAVLVESPNVVAEKALYATLIQATKSALRSRVKPPYPNLALPFGYLNRFVGELGNLGEIGTTASLLNLCEYSFENWESRQVEISFFGQKGSWYRRKLVARFQAKSGSVINTYSSWGGNYSGNPDGKDEFTRLLLSSKYVLCPPGNHANETSRYYEGIVAGAIPIVSRNSIQDNHVYHYWSSELLPPRFSATHTRLYEYVRSLEPIEQYELSQRIRDYEIVRLRKLRASIERFAMEKT